MSNSSWVPKINGGNTNGNTSNASEEFLDWMVHSTAEEARAASYKCECGLDSLYKNRKERPEPFQHSHWCPLWQERRPDSK